MFYSFGEIEVIIKLKSQDMSSEIFRRINEVENGAELKVIMNDELFEVFVPNFAQKHRKH